MGDRLGVGQSTKLGIRNDHFSFLVHSSHLPAYEDGTECSETSAYKLQTPGYYPKESIQHTEQGESLKSRIHHLFGEETVLFAVLFIGEG